MTDFYVIPAGGNNNVAATFSLTDGGAGGAGIPLAGDNVFCTALSGNFGIVGTLTCNNFNCTGYTGTLSGTAAIDLRGNLTLGAGMTRTFTGNINVNGATANTIQCNGISLASNITIAKGVGSITLLDALTNNTANTINHTNGTFDTNGQTLTNGVFIQQSTSARTLTLGASVLNIAEWRGPGANLTLNSGTSTINIGNGGSSHQPGLTFYDIVWNLGSNTILTFNSGSFRNLTFLAGAQKGNGASLGGNLTVTGTFKVLGNSVINRFYVGSSVPGTQCSIAAAAVDATSEWVDFQDINFSNAAFAVGASIGDCQGNSNITATTPATQTATGTASFTWSTHGWTSRVPLPQDDVNIPNAFLPTRVVTMDMPRAGKNITFTCTGNPLCQMNVVTHIFGSLQMAAGMTHSVNSFTFKGRSACILRSNGVVFGNGFNIENPGGSLTLADDYTFGGTVGLFNWGYGAFDDDGFNFTSGGGYRIAVTGAAFTLNMGACTWTFNGRGSGDEIFNVNAATTVNCNPANVIKITGAVAGATTPLRTFTGGGKTYGTLWFDQHESIPGRVAGSNTYGTFKVSPGRIIVFSASETQTAATWDLSGSTPTGNKLGRTTGLTGSYFSTPDSAANSVTGDIEIAFKASSAVWTAAITNSFVNKRGTSNPIWDFYLTNTFGFQWWDSGGTQRSVTFDSHGAGTAWSTREFRITLDVDNGAGGHVAKLEERIAGLWTQVGATKSAGAFTTSIRDTGSDPVMIGASGNSGNGSFVSGAFEYAEVRNGIGGPVVCGFYPNDHISGDTWVSSSPQGETWTRNGGAVVTKAGMVAITNNTTAALRTILSKSGGGTVSAKNITVVNSDANPATTFFAINGIDSGNNLDWTFGSYADRASAFSLDFSPVIEGECVRLADADFSLSLDSDAAGIAVGTGAADFSLNLDAAIVGEEGHLYADGAAEFDLSLDFSGAYFQKPNQRIVKVPVERDYLRVPTWNN